MGDGRVAAESYAVGRNQRRSASGRKKPIDPDRRAVFPASRTRCRSPIARWWWWRQCTGLRAEEVLALEWEDIDFENLSMKVVRAVVHGRVKIVKTEYSEDELPLDPDFAAILLDWKRRLGVRDARRKTRISTPWWGSGSSSSRVTVTGRHYHASPVQQDYIRPAWLLPCGVSEVRCGSRRLVLSRRADAQREAPTAS